MRNTCDEVVMRCFKCFITCGESEVW